MHVAEQSTVSQLFVAQLKEHYAVKNQGKCLQDYRVERLIKFEEVGGSNPSFVAQLIYVLHTLVARPFQCMLGDLRYGECR